MAWFLLFALPLIFGLDGQTEIPKVLIFEVIVVFLVGINMLRGKIHVPKVLGLVFGLTAVHMALGISPTDFLGNIFRLQGVFLLWLLLLWSALSSTSNRLVPRIWPWVSLLMLFFASLWIGTDSGRAIGTLGESNALAATAVFTWVWGGMWAVVPAGFLIWLSGSRSGFVALAIQVVMLGISKTRFKGYSLIIGLVLMSASLILPVFEQGKVWEDRTDIWQTAIAAGRAKPIFGWGFGNMEFALNQTAINTGNIIQYQTVDSSHNIFLDWWVQGGILGLGILVFLIVKGLRQDFYKQLALVGILTCLCFNPASIVTLVHFWWLIGQALHRPDHNAEVVQRS